MINMTEKGPLPEQFVSKGRKSEQLAKGSPKEKKDGANKKKTADIPCDDHGNSSASCAPKVKRLKKKE